MLLLFSIGVALAGQHYLVLDSVTEGSQAQVPAEFGDGECAFMAFSPGVTGYVPVYTDVMLGGKDQDITMIVQSTAMVAFGPKLERFDPDSKAAPMRRTRHPRMRARELRRVF